MLLSYLVLTNTGYSLSCVLCFAVSTLYYLIYSSNNSMKCRYLTLPILQKKKLRFWEVKISSAMAVNGSARIGTGSWIQEWWMFFPAVGGGWLVFTYWWGNGISRARDLCPGLWCHILSWFWFTIAVFIYQLVYVHYVLTFTFFQINKDPRYMTRPVRRSPTSGATNHCGCCGESIVLTGSLVLFLPSSNPGPCCFVMPVPQLLHL